VKCESTEVYHQRTPGRLTSTFTLEEIEVSINRAEAKILAYQVSKRNFTLQLMIFERNEVPIFVTFQRFFEVCYHRR
jgi:hypothetical protein